MTHLRILKSEQQLCPGERPSAASSSEIPKYQERLRISSRGWLKRSPYDLFSVFPHADEGLPPNAVASPVVLRATHSYIS